MTGLTLSGREAQVVTHDSRGRSGEADAGFEPAG